MPKIVDKYNNQIKKMIKVSNTSANASSGLIGEDPYKRYKQLLDNGDRAKAVFSAGDDIGNLSYVENGITVLLPYEELVKSAPTYEPHMKSRFIGSPVDVMVDRIDEENRTVYMKSGRDEVSEQRIQSNVVKELVTELEAGNRPKIMGRTISIKGDVAYVNILNLNILGMIRTKKWQKSYLRKLEDVTKPGDWFEFEVVSSRKEKGHQTAFSLSRVNLTEDPWLKVPEKYLTEGAVITVRCLEKPLEKSYWWGLCDSIPDIYIMGDYNNHGTVTVMESASYLCKVVRADRAKHILKVVPFSMVNDQFANQGLVDYLKRGKKKGERENG